MKHTSSISDWIRKNKETIATVIRVINFVTSLLIVLSPEVRKLKKRRHDQLAKQAFESEDYEKKVKALKKLLNEEDM